VGQVGWEVVLDNGAGGQPCGAARLARSCARLGCALGWPGRSGAPRACVCRGCAGVWTVVASRS